LRLATTSSDVRPTRVSVWTVHLVSHTPIAKRVKRMQLTHILWDNTTSTRTGGFLFLFFVLSRELVSLGTKVVDVDRVI